MPCICIIIDASASVGAATTSPLLSTMVNVAWLRAATAAAPARSAVAQPSARW